MTRFLQLACLVAVLSASNWAEARVQRFAVLVGNNEGTGDDGTLRYAESDAQRMQEALRQLGSFEAQDTALLLGTSADEVRRTLISINDRIRREGEEQAVLVFYYSGHADAESLHLGASRLALSELVQLVRGSSAEFRLLVLDACQTGAITRKKGGKRAAAFALPAESDLPGEGLALLTASAADEDAQESDTLKGSFFTHAFVSGLLGAADHDRDGAVVLEEAYRYAYDSTLRNTSRTAAGTQHPSFSYDLRGHGDLVLTRPGVRAGSRGLLHLPQGASYLVLRDTAEGAVVAEVSERDPVRALNLRAGRYFVRGRTPRALLEGHVDLAAGAETRIDPAALTRIEYAQLVRKGSGTRQVAQTVELGAYAHGALPNASDPAFGGRAAYRVDFARYALAAQLGVGRSSLRNDVLTAQVDELSLGVRVLHAWDLGARLSVEAGLGTFALGFAQRFATQGRAPVRRTPAGGVEALAALSVVLGRGVYARLEAAAQGVVVRMGDERRGRGRLEATGTGSLHIGLGKAF